MMVSTIAGNGGCHSQLSSYSAFIFVVNRGTGRVHVAGKCIDLVTLLTGSHGGEREREESGMQEAVGLRTRPLITEATRGGVPKQLGLVRLAAETTYAETCLAPPSP